MGYHSGSHFHPDTKPINNNNNKTFRKQMQNSLRLQTHTHTNHISFVTKQFHESATLNPSAKLIQRQQYENQHSKME